MIRKLFRWLLTFFKILPKPGIDLFRPEERLLYGYWNGSTTIWADPLVLYKKLMEIGPEISINIKVANSPMQGNIEASNSLAKQIRSIFNIAPFDPSNKTSNGLTESELIALLGHFLNYSEDVKKKLAGYVTVPTTSQDSASSSQSAPKQNPPTTTTSDSNSIEKDKSTETPIAPPSESVQPSDSSIPPLIILGPTQMEKVTHS